MTIHPFERLMLDHGPYPKFGYEKYKELAKRFGTRHALLLAEIAYKNVSCGVMWVENKKERFLYIKDDKLIFARSDKHHITIHLSRGRPLSASSQP